MTVVFEKSQEAEQKRLEFFKEMLFAAHKCLNIYVDNRYVYLFVDNTIQCKIINIIHTQFFLYKIIYFITNFVSG